MVALDDPDRIHTVRWQGIQNRAQTEADGCAPEPFERNIAWQCPLVSVPTIGVPGLPNFVIVCAIQVDGLVLPDEYNKKLFPYSTVSFQRSDAFKTIDVTPSQLAVHPASSMPNTLGGPCKSWKSRRPKLLEYTIFDLPSALATKLRMYRSYLRMDHSVPAVIDWCIVALDQPKFEGTGLIWFTRELPVWSRSVYGVEADVSVNDDDVFMVEDELTFVQGQGTFVSSVQQLLPSGHPSQAAAPAALRSPPSVHTQRSGALAQEARGQEGAGTVNLDSPPATKRIRLNPPSPASLPSSPSPSTKMRTEYDYVVLKGRQIGHKVHIPIHIEAKWYRSREVRQKCRCYGRERAAGTCSSSSEGSSKAALGKSQLGPRRRLVSGSQVCTYHVCKPRPRARLECSLRPMF